MTPVHVLCLTVTSEPQSIFLGVRASFISQEKLRPCLLSSESPLAKENGCPFPTWQWEYVLPHQGPLKSSFFGITATMMPGLAHSGGQERVRDPNYGAQGMA